MSYTKPLEIWVHRFNGEYAMTERNPCGCNPNDYTVYLWTYKSGFCWNGISRRKLTRLMSQRGYECIFTPRKANP